MIVVMLVIAALVVFAFTPFVIAFDVVRLILNAIGL